MELAVVLGVSLDATKGDHQARRSRISDHQQDASVARWFVVRAAWPALSLDHLGHGVFSWSWCRHCHDGTSAAGDDSTRDLCRNCAEFASAGQETPAAAASRAATASSSARSFHSTPAWPLTSSHDTRCLATSAISCSHRSWFLTGFLPAVRQPFALPAGDPPLGERRAHVDRVEVHDHVHRLLLQRPQPLDHRLQLHAVVGGLGLTAREFEHPVGFAQDGCPAARPGVSRTGAIRPQFDRISHAWHRIRPIRLDPQRSSVAVCTSC